MVHLASGAYASADELFVRMGLDGVSLHSGALTARTPIDGAAIGTVHGATPEEVERAVVRAGSAFAGWRDLPAPRRGEVVRRFGAALRTHKAALGALVTLETGKILSEALGEVQEMIDVCDFAVGLSRQLYGRTIVSERVEHRLEERWHPLGPVVVISAFNFPVAVWSWNAAIALVCGDPVIWKPSEKAPLSALACSSLLGQVLAEYEESLAGVHSLLLGGAHVGASLAAHGRIPLVSATGSTAMGRAVGPQVAARFGRSLLELGGNNAMIVTPSARLGLALRAILFSAVGTAGQRCTSLRRLFVHRSVHDELVERLAAAYASVVIGDPREDRTLMGPLIDGDAFSRMQSTLAEVVAEGGEVLGGERVLEDRFPHAFYVTPSLALLDRQVEVVGRETFAPVLHVIAYDELDEAIELQNGVEQGLSSSIFTSELREAERFLAASGSDCGIANVNVGPSGAEIGGAFGGEKATGGGRESGSDAWRAYMRRSTVTVNFSDDLPLAQGVHFELA